ncbi:Lrp/AsnC ligand binding domain-containing protein [Sphingomonas sp. PL-96]|nr:Lrp/AsnC ligand binding domain-containing protein [Sphingomonas sp. PL-96]MCC2976640.1 Lrp/AsnC ligand binding domain-containing protein [Sphingomonas sp. PL-96]
MAGDADFILRVRIADNQSLRKFLEQLTRIDLNLSVKTMIVLDEVKYKTALPIR